MVSIRLAGIRRINNWAAFQKCPACWPSEFDACWIDDPVFLFARISAHPFQGTLQPVDAVGVGAVAVGGLNYYYLQQLQAMHSHGVQPRSATDDHCRSHDRDRSRGPARSEGSDVVMVGVRTWKRPLASAALPAELGQEELGAAPALSPLAGASPSPSPPPTTQQPDPAPATGSVSVLAAALAEHGPPAAPRPQPQPHTPLGPPPQPHSPGGGGLVPRTPDGPPPPPMPMPLMLLTLNSPGPQASPATTSDGAPPDDLAGVIEAARPARPAPSHETPPSLLASARANASEDEGYPDAGASL